MESDSFQHGYALLIGVGRDLPVTVQDAKALADTLKDDQKADYPPDQVLLLTEAQATREGILQGLEWLKTSVERQSAGKATALIFYSGHGGVQNNDYFLLPHDYNLEDLPGTALAADDFTDRIDAIPAQKTIVLLDCCHAGGVKDMEKAGRPSRVENLVSPIVHALDKGSGRVIVASSSDEQKSYYLHGAPYSIFTACLLEALSGKNTPKNEPFVSFTQVWDYLDREVPKRAPGPQQPVIQAQNLTGFVLCRNQLEAVVAIPKIFIIYDPADTRYLEGLRKQLAVMARRGKLQHWDQSQLMAGSSISAALDQELRSSQLVVLLVSADYLSSDNCFELQEKAAQLGKPILPVIVRDCLYEEDDLIRDLPKEPLLDGKIVPAARWPDESQALTAAAHHINRKAKELQT